MHSTFLIDTLFINHKTVLIGETKSYSCVIKRDQRVEHDAHSHLPEMTGLDHLEESIFVSVLNVFIYSTFTRIQSNLLSEISHTSI